MPKSDNKLHQLDKATTSSLDNASDKSDHDEEFTKRSHPKSDPETPPEMMRRFYECMKRALVFGKRHSAGFQAYSAIAIAIVTAFYVFFAAGQWLAMRQSVDLTRQVLAGTQGAICREILYPESWPTMYFAIDCNWQPDFPPNSRLDGTLIGGNFEVVLFDLPSLQPIKTLQSRTELNRTPNGQPIKMFEPLRFSVAGFSIANFQALSQGVQISGILYYDNGLNITRSRPFCRFYVAPDNPRDAPVDIGCEPSVIKDVIAKRVAKKQLTRPK